MANTKKKINVISLDFDGCIFNWNYINSESSNRLVDTNKAFIKTITKRIHSEKFNEVTFMNGSVRQDIFIDSLGANAGNKGSCFTALHAFCDEFTRKRKLRHVKVHIDDFLMADIYGKKNPGDTFRAIIANDESFEHYRWLNDDSKLTILYAQMHKVASEYPDADIVYDFYDDRMDLLFPLCVFFKENPDLVPANVTLRFHQYSGFEISEDCIHGIKGTANVDHRYADSIWNMIACAGLDYDEFLRDKSVYNYLVKQLTGDKLKTFKDKCSAGRNDSENASVLESKASYSREVTGDYMGVRGDVAKKDQHQSHTFLFFPQKHNESKVLKTSLPRPSFKL